MSFSPPPSLQPAPYALISSTFHLPLLADGLSLLGAPILAAPATDVAPSSLPSDAYGSVSNSSRARINVGMHTLGCAFAYTPHARTHRLIHQA
mmetsp:Transcript_24506/g.68731  ORF Transcript_24506/g.68731 Transcript_24506/m.68731 type:complete len:93 (-) Transcript_24506:2426-2704(-)